MERESYIANKIGRYQISSAATEQSFLVTVLDTATGKIWTRTLFRGIGGEKQLIKTENQGKKIWDIPNK